VVYGNLKFETEMTMAVTANNPAPYATPSAVLDIIGRYRNRGLPSPVNRDVLGRAGIADTLIPRTLQTLYALDLIDPETGIPTATFEGLRLAPEPEFKSRLADWLKGAYGEVFGFVDPLTDDETRIRDAFRGYEPVGQQGRMVSLFQGLCAAAGLGPEKPAASASRTSGLRVMQFKSSQPRRASMPKQPSSLTSRPATIPLPGPLAGLLASLPLQEEGWTRDERENFVATFGVVLDFCFPIMKAKPIATKENGGQT
jgi:hypothetical protein